MINRKNIIIIGGGFSGMVTAYFASKFFKNQKIILIEKNSTLGGLYNSVSFNKKFIFDHGMHLFYQCRNTLINNFYFKILKKSEWNILKGVKKDIAGNFYNDKLNTNSPYINIDEINSQDKLSFFEDICKNIKKKEGISKNNINKENSLDKYYLNKFGKNLTYKIIDPIIKKLWGFDLKKIDVVASKIVLLDRIILFNKKIANHLIKFDFFRSRIAYPNQIQLPKKYQSKQTYGLYPKKFGMFNVIKKLEKILYNSKIEIYLNTSINSFLIKKNKINELDIKNEKNSKKITNISKIFWTVPIFGLIPLLKLKTKGLKFDQNKKQIFVYLLSKERPKMNNNYYFMCFDKGYATFRVTSYFEYCKDAKKVNNLYPICMELHFENGDQKLDYKKIALKELSKFKIVKNINSIKYVFTEKAFGFFPIMTKKNTGAIKKIKKMINKKDIKNLFLGTQSPEKGIFFMHNILDQNIDLLYKLKNE